MEEPVKPDLSSIEPSLRKQALQRLEDGNVCGFLLCAWGGSDNWLQIIAQNINSLKHRGLYEKGLLEAFIGTRLNNVRHPFKSILRLFSLADKDKLRAAGDEFPKPGPSKLYRGVAGREPDRRVKGISWTASLDIAIWYAGRFSNLADAAVYSVGVEEMHILAYTNGREEDEYFVLLPKDVNPARLTGIDIAGELERVCAERHQKNIEYLNTLR
jgi:hypothetical protein